MTSRPAVAGKPLSGQMADRSCKHATRRHPCWVYHQCMGLFWHRLQVQAKAAKVAAKQEVAGRAGRLQHIPDSDLLVNFDACAHC